MKIHNVNKLISKIANVKYIFVMNVQVKLINVFIAENEYIYN